MILACPSCHTRYLISAAHFAAGPRTVRCGRCKHSWTGEIPDMPAGTASLPPGTINPSIISLAALPGPPKQTKSFWKNDWFMAAAVLATACAFLWVAIDRRDIAEQWPSTEAFYDRIGLHIYHAGEGLVITDVRSEIQFDGGTTQLTVEGQIHNKTNEPQPIPDILAAAVGPDGKVMQSWQIDAPKATLAPGENVPFTSEIQAPQGTVVDINLHFIETSHAT